MQIALRHLAIVLVLTALSVVGWTALGQRQRNDSPQPKSRSSSASAPTWEYKVTPANLTQEDMNKLGAEGWELAAVYAPNIANTALYFKRLKK